jgi:protein involved in polysaccharide export with SLBB domain
VEQLMVPSHITIATQVRNVLATGAVALIAACLATPAQSSGSHLVPQTKLRLSVIQWMPTKGVYEQWQALSGEFVVAQDGTIELPVVGSVSVADLDSAGLASEIAKRIQTKIGLVQKPEATVEIIEYPPIYVVGDVTTPGEYRFRDGLTALQVLALSGGAYRSPVVKDRSNEVITLSGQLQGIGTDIVRKKAEIARLEAEMSGSTDIKFPAMTAEGTDNTIVSEIFAREKIIFMARAKELDRQTKSLAELCELLKAEIDVLGEKIKAADANIESAEKELATVTVLVDKGIALASRKSDLERTLANYRTDRLDQVTAVMRARQATTEATRNMEGLRDAQQTEVASELQKEQGELEQLVLKRNVSQKLLFDALGSASETGEPGADQAVTFVIVRRDGSEPKEITATESTSLLPGDVIKVTLTASSQQSELSPATLGSIAAADGEIEGSSR